MRTKEAAIALAATFALFGCSEPPVDADVIRIFQRSDEAFELLASLCKDNPSLRVIDWNYGHLEIRPSGVEESVQRRARALLARVLAKDAPQQIDCLHYFDKKSDKLAAVRFIYQGRRFGLKGNYTALHRDFGSPASWIDESIMSGQLRFTGTAGWYIYHSR